MTIYLGLGSNLGDRRENLSLAIARLQQEGFRIEKVSPVVESPAMLPDNAAADWARPFLNLVVAGKASWSPEDGLDIAKRIEHEIGRQDGPRWSPRPIDIDLLLWGDQTIHSDRLVIPHPRLAERDFVITPLLHLAPGLVVPGLGESVMALSRGRRNIPLWMAIVNVTPDSFSDGNSWFDRDQLARHIDELVSENIQIIDIGAESTRPRAESVDPALEWSRLQPVITLVQDRLSGLAVKPLLSVDSRHPLTMRRAVAAGIDIVNDVTGLDDPEMMAVARDSGCHVVAMHAMTVPVDPAKLLPDDRPAVEQLVEWIHDKAETWVRHGLALGRMIVDPGIGFGKSPVQAFQLMSDVEALRSEGMRVLIGHSRKSFMAGFTEHPAADRDIETVGISLAIASQGVDVIRVHNAVLHQRAYRGWSHIDVR